MRWRMEYVQSRTTARAASRLIGGDVRFISRRWSTRLEPPTRLIKRSRRRTRNGRPCACQGANGALQTPNGCYCVAVTALTFRLGRPFHVRAEPVLCEWGSVVSAACGRSLMSAMCCWLADSEQVAALSRCMRWYRGDGGGLPIIQSDVSRSAKLRSAVSAAWACGKQPLCAPGTYGAEASSARCRAHPGGANPSCWPVITPLGMVSCWPGLRAVGHG